MGFLDNLIKRKTKEIISAAVSSAVDGFVSSSINGKSESTVSNGITTYGDTTYSTTKSSSRANTGEYGGEAGLRTRLEKILEEEWSGYEIRRQVPASTFGAAEGAWDYSYGVYAGGQPKAMLMVLNNRNDYKRKAVLDAQGACKANGIPYMNFLSHMPNRSDYISQRLRDNIQF